MSAGQWAVVAALLALALVGIPAAAVGWTLGQWALRDAVDPYRLRPVGNPPAGVRLVDDTLPLGAGRFPVDVGLVRSEIAAGQDRAARDVALSAAEAEVEIAAMIAHASAATRRIPWL